MINEKRIYKATITPVIVQTHNEPVEILTQISKVSSSNPEYPKRAAVTALTDYYALDVYETDDVTYDTSKQFRIY